MSPPRVAHRTSALMRPPNTELRQSTRSRIVGAAKPVEPVVAPPMMVIPRSRAEQVTG